MKKAIAASIWCLLTASSAAMAADTKVVLLNDGREIVGEVTKVGDVYQIKPKMGVTLSLSASQVVSIRDYVAPDQEFSGDWPKIDPNNPEDHYNLAQWAFDNALYDQARQEAQAALAIKKDYERAAVLMRLMNVKLRESTTKPSSTGPAGGETVVIKPEWLVGEDDISHIRLEELRSSDSVVIQFRNKVVDRFLDRMMGRQEFRDDPRARDKFAALSPIQQTMYILDNIDREDSGIKDDILVKSDPKFMIDFRSKVWPIVAQSCGTIQCHGAQKVQGGFKVFNLTGQNERLDYTNFVLMIGFVGKNGQRLISRDHPEDSLLLLYGLPPELSGMAHPQKIQPIFDSRTSTNYQIVFRWLDSLRKPRSMVVYRLQYKPPLGLKLELDSVPNLPPPSNTPSAASKPI